MSIDLYLKQLTEDMRLAASQASEKNESDIIPENI